MLTRFVQDNGAIYRILLQAEDGAWIISYDEPAAPFFVAAEALGQMERIPTPAAFIEASACVSLTAAQAERLRLIQPLLDAGERVITERSYRLSLAKEVAAENDTKTRRILRLYSLFLAKGVLTEKKHRKPQERADFDWAIKTFYYSAKRLSLRASYEMMLVQRYTDSNGQLYEGAPSWSSFRQYFYSRDYHKRPQKVIAREGLTAYQRGHRPAFGSAAQWKPEIGAYQMDATLGDVYLTCRQEKELTAGRPTIILAVDSASQLIAGIYVGFASDETAVMQCLAQAASDKVAYCKQFGIDITPEQWPSSGLPYEVVTDRGREFMGGRMQELCRRYGMEVQALPPFRPDQKSAVEKTFDLLQQRYIPMLRGKGAIAPDAQERWSIDYRSQATLDLNEFTQVMIHCVIYLNSGRVLSNGKTSAQMWLESETKLLEVPQKELDCMALPRAAAKLSRKGFRFNGMYYTPEDSNCLYIGGTYTVAYNPANISCIYAVTDDSYIRCPLAYAYRTYAGLSEAEVNAGRRHLQQASREAKQQELKSSVAATRSIQRVLRNAGKHSGEKQTGEEIRAQRDQERSRLT